MENCITSISLNLTKKCNLNCSYCFTYGISNNTITIDIAKRTINWLFKNAIECNEKDVQISFWGGEPLLEWELLKEIVIYGETTKPSNINLSWGGTTNGTLLTKEKFDFLEQFKIYFLMSVDGKKESHDKNRLFNDNTGSHDIVISNLKDVLIKWPFYKVRLSLCSENIDTFYDDVKYLIELGVNNIIFSPVYEGTWTVDIWEKWEKECYKIVDLLDDYQKNDREIKIEHFISYIDTDTSKHPCGAGRNYVGIDTDGSIWPCHRFIKFNDNRHWQEKEMCIGHIEYGITRPDVRNKFIDFNSKCKNKECFKGTPCHGGCYAANYDLTGDITTPYNDICNYVEHQVKVSKYYNERIKPSFDNKMGNCICYNMCYLEGTENEIKILTNKTDMRCQCYNTNYTGKLNTELANPITQTKVTPQDVLNELKNMSDKFISLEHKIEQLIQVLIDRK